LARNMTSSPTPAVLPDARARLQEAVDRRLGFRRGIIGTDRVVVTRDDLAALLAAAPPAPITEGVTCITKPLTDAERQAGIDQWITPPASDAAVPAGKYEARFVAGGAPTDCVNYGVISLAKGVEVCRVWQVDDARLIANLLNTAAAPKVASDTEQRNSHDDAKVYGIGIEVDGVAIHPGRVVIRKRKVASDTALPNSWVNTREAEREQAMLLAEVELHLQQSRVFITSREKMHPCGVELHDELQAKVTAALDAIGREKSHG